MTVDRSRSKKEPAGTAGARGRSGLKSDMGTPGQKENTYSRNQSEPQDRPSPHVPIGAAFQSGRIQAGRIQARSGRVSSKSNQDGGEAVSAMVKPVFVAVGSALLLAGCVERYWDKPGGTAAEWEQVKAACMLEGAGKVPVVPVYVLDPGSSYTSYYCDKSHRNCSTFDTITPPSYRQEDANAELRDQVVRGCFARNGWTEKVRSVP